MRWLVFLIVLLLSAPPSAAQTGERIYRLAHVAPSKVSMEETRRATFPELAKLGFVEGRNLVNSEWWGDSAALPRLMEDMLRSKPDAIIAIGPDAVRAAAAATKTIPIISFGPDIVFLGMAASQTRPGGNVTGVLILAAQLDAKRLDLLKQALPVARRFSVLLPMTPQRDASERAMRNVAADAKLTLHVVDAGQPAEYAPAFGRMRGAGAEAVVIGANATFYRDGRRLAALALEAKLPSICEWADMAEMGCMIGYGPNRTEMRRRLAYYAARIFAGTPAGELPVELPTHFELALNLKVARMLGVTIAADVQARADSVIE
jgi:putative ABC transport system substrate-binding protein